MPVISLIEVFGSPLRHEARSASLVYMHAIDQLTKQPLAKTAVSAEATKKALSGMRRRTHPKELTAFLELRLIPALDSSRKSRRGRSLQLGHGSRGRGRGERLDDVTKHRILKDESDACYRECEDEYLDTGRRCGDGVRRSGYAATTLSGDLFWRRSIRIHMLLQGQYW